MKIESTVARQKKTSALKRRVKNSSYNSMNSKNHCNYKRQMEIGEKLLKKNHLILKMLADE